jgi:hypothetical protein
MAGSMPLEAILNTSGYNVEVKVPGVASEYINEGTDRFREEYANSSMKWSAYTNP